MGGAVRCLHRHNPRRHHTTSPRCIQRLDLVLREYVIVDADGGKVHPAGIEIPERFAIVISAVGVLLRHPGRAVNPDRCTEPIVRRGVECSNNVVPRVIFSDGDWYGRVLEQCEIRATATNGTIDI